MKQRTGRNRTAHRRLLSPPMADTGACWPPAADAHGTGVLHEARVEAVLDAIRESGVDSVVDLGCGSGVLLLRLVEQPQLLRIAGIDSSVEAVNAALRRRALKPALQDGRLRIACASFTAPLPADPHFEAAVMLETIEHVDPRHLSQVERAVFTAGRAVIVVTTPNADYNPLYGMAAGQVRHPDHRFEWTRPKFRAWATGVAARNGYRVTLSEIGMADPLAGAPSQMAVFRRFPA